jgi:hypothetical protein
MPCGYTETGLEGRGLFSCDLKFDWVLMLLLLNDRLNLDYWMMFKSDDEVEK